MKNINFRIAAIASLALMLGIMLWVSKDFGITGDEVTQNNYGRDVYSYYSSFGKKDIESIVKDDGDIRDANKNVYMYGGFYELVCAVVNKFSPFDPFNTRHFINAIFGFLIIVASAQWARWYKGWGAALLTAWFLFLTPRFFGESMNNPKDIPFALGMVWGAYQICRFAEAFPMPGKKRIVLLILSIAYAISIRSGGLLLLPFLFVVLGMKWFFEWRKQAGFTGKEMSSLIKNTLLVCVLGYIGGLIFWPYGLENPISNPLTSLSELTKFSTGIRMLFSDEHITSTYVPWYYIPKWLFITMPVIILAGIILSPVLFTRKQYNFTYIFFLFFTALFPLLYVIYKKSPLYDGWRHMLFIYPPLVIISALTFISFIERYKIKYVQYGIAVVVFLGLLLPAKYCLANHPNEIVYFNELEGGVSGAYGFYETDYYMNSVKQAAYKLAKSEDLYNTKDTVVIASNAIEPLLHYVETFHNPNVFAVYVKYSDRYAKKWDYGIFLTRTIDKGYLQNGYFPPAGTIETIKADGAPICAIVKKTPGADYSYQATQYFNAKDFNNAIIYYQKALTEDPKNETVYINYAISLASTGRMKEAIDAINQGLKYTPFDIGLYDILSKLYEAVGDTHDAQLARGKAQELMNMPEDAAGE